MRANCYLVLIALAVCIGAAFRLTSLNLRPMHTDEAVHAVKFGYLLEDNYYKYDPVDYHGPILNYLTLISAKISGIKKISMLQEKDLRVVTAVGGILLFLLPLLASKFIGKGKKIICCLLVAVSPAFVFYSRYYIQEIFLVLFNYAFLFFAFHYISSRKLRWGIFSAVSFALMLVTKETFVLSLVALIPALVFINYGRLSSANVKEHINVAHMTVMFFCAAAILVLFYSSFFSNISGLVEPLKYWRFYFDKASSGGLHDHKWYYYVQLLSFSKISGGVIFSELSILVFAAFGYLDMFVLKKRTYNKYERFIAVYALSLFVVYSLIPYKTPWCMLSFYYGFIIMAGVFLGECLKQSKKSINIIMLLFICSMLVNLAFKSFLANFVYYCTPGNPYVYAHTSEDVKRVPEVIQMYAQKEYKPNPVIAVVFSGDDYWPLPWQLRKFSEVGYYNCLEDIKGDFDVIIVSGDIALQLGDFLYKKEKAGERNLWLPLFEQSQILRPGVEFKVFGKGI